MIVASHSGDPLIHHGRHFGRTVHAMCNVQLLILNSVERIAASEEVAEESLTFE